MAAVFADKGHTVVGVDVDPNAVSAINEGRAPVSEPGLQGYIERNRNALSATSDCQQAVLETDITFIIVPTPSQPDGTFTMKNVAETAKPIGRALRQKRGYHLVVLSSTVMPGSTEGQLLAALEEYSGKSCGPDFGLCYNPEFIALGSVIHDMLNPDIVLIGESDDRAGSMLAALQRGVCDNDASIQRMNFVNAELTKLSVNTFVTTKISYANMLAEICERLPGADVDVVTSALGLDSRIGRKYLKGALGYGGPCFPRDNLAFAALGRQQDVEATLAEATDRVNRRQPARLVDLVLKHLPPGGSVGVLGLAYKPDTCVSEQSQGLLLAEQLVKKNVPVVVYDPEALENARRVLGDKVAYANSAEECAGQVQVLVIATPWEPFKRLRPEHLAGHGRSVTVVDCWRILAPEKFQRATNYILLGLGIQNESRPAMAGLAASSAEK
jgi:UDPglucose 6-dehydrogenase